MEGELETKREQAEQPEQKESEQIVEGVVDDVDNWWEQLPAGVKKEDVITRKDRRGRLEWHLREGAIKNPTPEQIRRARAFEEEEIWRG